MDRPNIFSESQIRSYDHAHAWCAVDLARGRTMQDLMGTTATVVSQGGLAATPSAPASLTVEISAGNIYQLAALDATAYGPLNADMTLTMMQGYALAQSVLLTTSGLSSGQSRWALIWAEFNQVDAIPGDDPTAGLLSYLNTANPAGPPYSGPNDDNTPQNTLRQGICTIGVTYGSVATTGSEAPPNPPGGAVGLYLIDLDFGQSTVTSGDILVAGPSVGSNVPSNYPAAPFLAGLLNSHHGGVAGQAPKILLAELLAASSARSGGGVGVIYVGSGNPNGSVAGTAGAAGVSAPDFYVNLQNGALYYCSTTGDATHAAWTQVAANSSGVSFAGTAPSTGTANAQIVAATTPAGFALTAGYSVTLIPGATNTAGTTLNVDSTGATTVKKNSGGSLVALTGSEFTVGVPVTVTFDGTEWVVQAGVTLGALALLGIGPWLASSGGNLTLTLPETQAFLGFIGTSQLQLQAVNGGALWINGFNYPIPASLNLSNGGLSASTAYNVYAFMNSGTMTLEAVTTAPTLNANGIYQKTGDASRTLVGQATTDGSGNFQANNVGTFSQYHATVVFAAGITTGSANAQVASAVSPPGFALNAGNAVNLVAGFTNTAATTLAIGGTAATAVNKLVNGSLTALAGGEIVQGAPFTVIDNGTVWVLMTASSVTSPRAYRAVTSTGAGLTINLTAADGLVSWEPSGASSATVNLPTSPGADFEVDFKLGLLGNSYSFGVAATFTPASGGKIDGWSSFTASLTTFTYQFKFVCTGGNNWRVAVSAYNPDTGLSFTP